MAPQWAAKQCWAELPEANRRAAVKWLAVLASRIGLLAKPLTWLAAIGQTIPSLAILALMLPFSVTLLVLWTAFLLGFWALGIPLGLDASYAYPGG